MRIQDVLRRNVPEQFATVSNPRTTPTHLSLIPTSGDPKCILHDLKTFQTVHQCKDFWQIDEAEHELIYTLDLKLE